MQKIPTLLVRDETDRRYVTDEVSKGCDWVMRGDCIATRKYDGTCVAYLDLGQEPRGPMWWARHELKKGKLEPWAFHLVSTDVLTGKSVGWVPMSQNGRWKQFQEALEELGDARHLGTYELCGPKVNRNPEGYAVHTLIRHTEADRMYWSDRTPEGAKQLVRDMHEAADWEGIVWHHISIPHIMAKLKFRDLRP